MKKLAPYWFLETPIDEEHKRYVLLAYLKSIEEELKGPNKITYLRELSALLRNMRCYAETGDFFPATLAQMSEPDKKKLRKLEKIVEKESKKEEIQIIIESTKATITEFLNDHSDEVEEVESLYSISVNKERKRFFWDKGYLVIKNHTLGQIQVYLWKFAPIKIKGEEQLALLMSICYAEELPEEVGLELEASNEEIEKKLKEDFGAIYNRDCDPVVVVNLFGTGTILLESDFGKEKASDFIVETYKNFLKKF